MDPLDTRQTSHSSKIEVSPATDKETGPATQESLDLIQQYNKSHISQIRYEFPSPSWRDRGESVKIVGMNALGVVVCGALAIGLLPITLLGVGLNFAANRTKNYNDAVVMKVLAGVCAAPILGIWACVDNIENQVIGNPIERVQKAVIKAMSKSSRKDIPQAKRLLSSVKKQEDLKLLHMYITQAPKQWHHKDELLKHITQCESESGSERK